jgi:hypothetical protein
MIPTGILTSTSSTSITPILDLYPGAVAAYSLRKLRTAYIGNAIRVRRSSDNTETDIGFTSSGNLDITTLSTFCGANSGYISKWYDQSGNTYTIEQFTTSYQPIIYNSGTYLGYILYDGVNDILPCTLGSITWNGSSTALITAVSAPDASTPNNSNDSAATIQVQETGSWGTIYLTIGPTFLKWRYGTGQVNNDNSYTKSSSTSNCVVNINKSSTVETLYFNNSLVMTATGKLSTLANNSPTYFNFGKSSNYAACWKGYQKEIIMYNSNQSANISGINSNINSYYTIY